MIRQMIKMSDELGMAVVNMSGITLATILTFLPIEIVPLVGLTILMIIDFFVGVAAAWRCGEEITSKRIKIGVLVKCSALLVLMSAGFVLSTMKFSGTDVWCVWLLNMLIFSEFYSIVANTYALKTGDKLPELEVFAIIAKKLRDIIDVLDPETKGKNLNDQDQQR